MTLDQVAERIHAGVVIREDHAGGGQHGGRGAHAQRDFRDDAEGSLRADHQRTQVRAGRTGGDSTDPQRPARSDHQHGLHHLVAAAVTCGGLAGGASGCVAANCGAMPRLRVVAHGEAAGGKEALQLRSGHARAHGDQVGFRVDCQQHGHSRHVQHDGGSGHVGGP